VSPWLGIASLIVWMDFEGCWEWRGGKQDLSSIIEGSRDVTVCMPCHAIQVLCAMGWL
jgi:hypothetical protein